MNLNIIYSRCLAGLLSFPVIVFLSCSNNNASHQLKQKDTSELTNYGSIVLGFRLGEDSATARGHYDSLVKTGVIYKSATWKKYELPDGKGNVDKFGDMFVTLLDNEEFTMHLKFNKSLLYEIILTTKEKVVASQNQEAKLETSIAELDNKTNKIKKLIFEKYPKNIISDNGILILNNNRKTKISVLTDINEGFYDYGSVQIRYTDVESALNYIQQKEKDKVTEEQRSIRAAKEKL